MPNKDVNKNNILLSFEFSDENGQIKPLTFKQPHSVITTKCIEDVLPCLEKVQEAVHNGYYAAGFLSYESAPAFDSSYMVHNNPTMPLLWFGIFSDPQPTTLTSNGSYSIDKWKPSVRFDQYHDSIKTIKHYIENGETYQANYTIQMNSQFDGDDIALYNKLRKAQSSNYCAYIHTGEHSILSASPELFFRINGNKITTRPMKGTVKRGKSFAEDKEKAKWLYHSEKNRAENIMIVDLLRNDLGVIAESNSVHVTNLFDIEQYPTVHQMTSTIEATIPENIQLVEIFKALFPCGSITGAPKISTMEILTELEMAPREVYCGAIGYITPNRKATFNVPIRTVLIEQSSGKAVYGVGGGITWDSSTEDEYDEVIAKASFLDVDRPDFQLLESFLLENGVYFLIDEHLQRLKNSSHYFGFHLNDENIEKALNEFASQNSKGSFKVRLLTDKIGEITIEGQPIINLDSPGVVILTDEPINSNDPFLYHKTTHRGIYSHHYKKKQSSIFDVLLWNENGELTEFTNGNIVLEIEDTLWTPPVNSGLLAGTFRESLLKKGIIQEKVLTKNDLNTSKNIWFINSVRKWLKVELVENKKAEALSEAAHPVVYS